MLAAVAAGAYGDGRIRCNEQSAHIDILLRDIGDGEEAVSAGVEGNIAVVIGAGKKPQHRNGSLGRGITVGLRRGLVVCLRKVVRPAKVGGKANDIAHQVGRTGDICYHLILFCGGLCGLGFLCVGGQGAQAGQQHAAGEDAEKLFFHRCLHLCFFQVKLTVFCRVCQGLRQAEKPRRSVFVPLYPCRQLC